jgi:hypothetical protein
MWFVVGVYGVVSTILIVASAPGDLQNRGGTSVA